MIITEFYRVREDGINLYKTYSDKGLKIENEQTGAVYDEVINIENRGYTYTETNIPIEIEEEDYRAAALTLLGREDEI